MHMHYGVASTNNSPMRIHNAFWGYIRRALMPLAETLENAHAMNYVLPEKATCLLNMGGVFEVLIS